MSWIDKLERKFGKFAIPHLTYIMLFGHVVTFFLVHSGQVDIVMKFFLIGEDVKRGEVWRLFSFMLLSDCYRMFWFIFKELLFVMFGTMLERHWGTFKYNMFLFISMFSTIVVSFFIPFLPMDSRFIISSIIIGFAITFPNYPISLFLLPPIPVKYLGFVEAALIVYYLFDIPPTAETIIMATYGFAGCMNIFVFFSAGYLIDVKHFHRKQQFERKLKEANAEPMHVCSVCGRTSRDDRYMEFRYVKKDGELVCLCEDHLGSVSQNPEPSVEA